MATKNEGVCFCSVMAWRAERKLSAPRGDASNLQCEELAFGGLPVQSIFRLWRADGALDSGSNTSSSSKDLLLFGLPHLRSTLEGDCKTNRHHSI